MEPMKLVWETTLEDGALGSRVTYTPASVGDDTALEINEPHGSSVIILACELDQFLEIMQAIGKHQGGPPEGLPTPWTAITDAGRTGVRQDLAALFRAMGCGVTVHEFLQEYEPQTQQLRQLCGLEPNP